MTPNSSVYRLNSISEYSRALESVRVVSKAVSLVEQGKAVDNFSVYEEAFENLNRSLAAAKARGNMTPQLQQASAKLEGLLEKLSKRVEAASARVKEASSASFGTRMIGWVLAPKEQILGAAKTAGNAGQWAWSHKKTVAGGVIVGSAIYNDAFGSFRTAVSACKTFWTVITGIPPFVNQFFAQSEEAIEEITDTAKNVKQAAQDGALPFAAGQELLRQNIEKCRNAESGAECVEFMTANFEAMKECLPGSNEPFDLKRWFWCVDNKISGESMPFEQFKDERTSQVANTALNVFAHVAAARFLGLKIPGGEFFNNYISPWIVPNALISSVYPQYLEDVKTYCASHPVICAVGGVAAFTKGWMIGAGAAVTGVGLNYVDQQFLNGGMSNTTQYVLNNPQEIGRNVRDELLEDSDLSLPLAAVPPTVWSVFYQMKEMLAANDELEGALLDAGEILRIQGNIAGERDALREIKVFRDLINQVIPENLDDVGGLVDQRLNAQGMVDNQERIIEELQAMLPAVRAAPPRYIPSWKMLSILGACGFLLPKLPKVVSAISSTASDSNMTLSDVLVYVMEKAPALIVPQTMIDNQGTIITTLVISILPQLAMFGLRRLA